MNLSKLSIKGYLIFSLLLTLLTPILWPTLRIGFCLPCLIALFYQNRLIDCLWFSFAIGLFLDLISSHTLLGLNAASLCAATALLYPQKKHFFSDSLTTLPILTALIASSSALVQAMLVYVFEKEVHVGVAWMLTDMVILPLLDAAFAFAVFLLPTLLFGKPRRRGSDYFIRTERDAG